MSYGAPPPSNPYGGGAYGGQPTPTGTNGKAIGSLVTGILGVICCGFLTGIPAIILAVMARKDIARTGQKGSGLATAGLVLGVLSILLGILSLILISTGNFYIDFDSN